ncbi:MAG: O-antigen ligase family protein [Pseudomonadota bacterium]|nr:O-antigen ligase family protein [Pseudomonadota bacterium]
MKFLAIWLVYAFLSIMWSADQIAAFKNIIFLFTGISIIFFLVYYMRDINHLHYLYWIWISIFIALIPVGLWEITTGNHLVGSALLEEDRPWVAFAPTTVFVNQNDYAAFIVLAIPMIITAIRHYSKLYIRVVGVLVLLCGLFLLIMTTSRSCYLALFTGLAFWFIFLLNLRKKLKTLALVISICGLIILASPVYVQDTLLLVQDQISSLSDVSGQSDDLGAAVRPNLIKNALHFTAQTAGFGVGAGNAEYYMDHYKIYPTGGITNVHNWWAEIAVNYGIFIFVGYVVLYITLIFNLWRAYKRLMNHTEKMICEALLVGLVSFFMASISSSSIIAFSPQWIFFGFALAFLNYTRIKASERRNLCTF